MPSLAFMDGYQTFGILSILVFFFATGDLNYDLNYDLSYDLN